MEGNHSCEVLVWKGDHSCDVLVGKGVAVLPCWLRPLILHTVGRRKSQL